VSQAVRRKVIELAAALVAAALTAAIALDARTAPLPQAAPAPAPREAFAAICAADALQDTRTDPAWVLASYEGDHCQAPVMPAALNGRTATREEIVVGMQAAKLFAARSEAFQKCISTFVAARRPQASASAERSFRLVENHRIQVSEKNRKKANAQIAAAIEAFNAFGSECP
jgi:hypothetical protein